MLEQYPAKAHCMMEKTTQRLVPLPKGHKLSVLESAKWQGFEIALLNSKGLVRHPLFQGDEVFFANTVAEIEEIILTLQKELA
jgi:hypothetical protein